MHMERRHHCLQYCEFHHDHDECIFGRHDDDPGSRVWLWVIHLGQDDDFLVILPKM